MTVVAEDDTRLVGFVHVLFDDDDRWGSRIDNLHITQDRRRTGIGTTLLTFLPKPLPNERQASPRICTHSSRTPPLSSSTEPSAAPAPKRNGVAPGGVPARLNGSPNKLRFTWPDASLLACTTGHSLPQTDPRAGRPPAV